MRRLAIICLVISGSAGLIDEVVWSRGVGVLLGSTATAHALTLGVFMGGLALGAAFFGRLADRSRDPFRLYALLEIGVAISTVATPALLRLCTAVFEKVAVGLYPQNPFAVGSLKTLIALILLLPPTLLMGGTLPVMVRALVKSGSEVGLRVSHLYAANSLGGVFGTLLGGLVLVAAIGLDRCAIFASSLNLLAAALAMVASLRSRESADFAEGPAPALLSSALEDLMPGLEEGTPEFGEQTPGLRDQPAFGEQTPGLRDRNPEFGDRTSGLRDRNPEFGERTPGLRDREPEFGERTPVFEDRNPGLKDRNPAFGEQTPGLGEQTPGLGDPTPGLDEQSPKLGEQTPALGVPSSELADLPSRLPTLSSPPPALVRAVVVAMGLSGISALVYETLWIRLLSLVLGGTAHAFPLMLSAFIGGITAGAFWAGRKQRNWEQALQSFVRVELLAAAVVGLAFWSYQRLPWLILLLGQGAAKNQAGYFLYLLLAFGLCLIIMAIPAACIGATLPLAAQVAASRSSTVGRQFGGVYAWNTLGNVIGAVSGGLILLPALGLKGAFIAAITVNVLAGLLPLFIAARSEASRAKASPGVAAQAQQLAMRRLSRATLAGGLAVLVLILAPFEPMLLSQGVFRQHGINPGPFSTFRESFTSVNKLLFHEDGADSTVEVHEHETGVLALRINGKPDASTGDDMQTQLMCGHLPMLFHPNPKNVLVIGLGSGATVAAVLRHGEDVRVTVVELSPEVVRASRFFSEVNDDALNDPRVTLVVDDARTFVRLNRELYDVIIAEPSNPWMAGISGLFTQDFFRELKARLAPGGLVLQWTQLYETNDEIIRMVVRTFKSVVGEASGWGTDGADLLMISGFEPLQIDWEDVAQRMNSPQVRESLSRASVHDPAALAALHMLSNQTLDAYAGDGPLHSDSWPLLEYAGARSLFIDSWAEGLISRDERQHLAAANLAIGAYLKGRALHADEAAAVAHAVKDWAPHNPAIYLGALRQAAELDPQAHYPALVEALEDEYASYSLGLGFPADPGEGAHRAQALLGLADSSASEEVAQSSIFRAPKLEPQLAALREALDLGLADKEAKGWTLLAKLLAMSGKVDEARQALSQAKTRAKSSRQIEGNEGAITISTRQPAEPAPAPLIEPGMLRDWQQIEGLIARFEEAEELRAEP